MPKPFIPILLGTARAGRESEKAAKFVFEEVKKFAEVKTEFFDVRDFITLLTVPSWEKGEKNVLWQKIMAKADGLIVVSPEYNHGYPGELKIVLDGAYKEYEGKPLGICGVSASPIGGARMAEQLRLVSVELKMIPARNAVYFSGIKDLFDAKGKIKDESYKDRIKTLLDEMLAHVKK
ncbi:MAG: NAD(P)H-dependent oxidoreductase [bacterium]